ncbi:MAG: hypothetical protein K1X88_20190 [Nannocystaceae bacterium]|nr:hypothetical protein [Nannocystaceae bacterium]
MAGALAVIGLLGCAPKLGWQRDDRRACASDEPAVVCVASEPDRGLAFVVGAVEILPGECAQAPDGGGRVRVAWTDRDGHAHHRSVRAPAHRRTTVVLQPDGTLHAQGRARCDARP